MVRWSLLVCLMCLSLFISCGKSKDSSNTESMGIVNSLAGKKESVQSSDLTEEQCIDQQMQIELVKNEEVERIYDDSDINFCNGLRIRLKIYKMSNEELKAYGFAQSSSGKMSCLKKGDDFKKTPLFGYRGTLIGEGIKIALGGHEFNEKDKLIPSKKFKGKFVSFDGANYSGEVAFFEDGALKCWAIH